MIVTRADAARIIGRYYGEEFAKSVRFRPRGVSVYCRPSYEVSLGMPTLCSRKIIPGKDSTIWIGLLLPGGGIDWNWSPEA